MNVNGLRLVAMMCLVVVLTGCNNNNAKKIARQRDDYQRRLNASQLKLNDAQNQNDLLSARLAKLAGAENENANLRAKLRAASSSRTARANTGFEGINGVEAELTAKGISVRMPGDVLFSPGKANIKASAKRSLDKIARTIRNQYPSHAISIEGFTDSDPIRKSKWKDNWDLSGQRAAAVLRYLNKQGRIPTSKLQSVAHGRNKSRGTKAKSRRVEIIVLRG